MVYAKYSWIYSKADAAGVSIYSERPANITHSRQFRHSQFLFKVFLDHARKNPKKQALGQSQGDWVCNDLLLNKCGYGYLAFHLGENSRRKLGIELN